MINDYDIAVIKVTPTFTYNSFTKAVDLAPDNAENVFTEWGIVCGWGYYLVNRNYYNNITLYRYCIIIPFSLFLKFAYIYVKKNNFYEIYTEI